MNKILTIIILTFLLPNIAQGINNTSVIYGVIKSEANEFLECASIVIAKESKTDDVIDFTTSDEFGKFKINVGEGNYLLKVSYVGYEMYSQKIAVEDRDSVSVGEISLTPSMIELQTIVIEGQPLNVHMRPDGFSINTTQLSKSSNNAFDLLGRLPYVRIKGAELSVIGKETVIVKINDVVQRVNESELANILRGYDASLIKKVEVLTSPPQRYNPDGNTAMIVIHTNSFFEQYMGGIIGSELMKGENYNGRYGGYTSLVLNNKKLYANITPSYNHTASYIHEKTIYNYADDDFYELSSPSEGDQDYIGSTFIAQYKYNKNGLIGFTGSIGGRTIKNRFFSKESDSQSIISNQNNALLKQPKGNFTAYWEHSTSKNTKIWLETSYYNHLQRSDISFISEENGEQLLSYDDYAHLHVKGFGLNNDYSIALNNKFNLDFGLKIILTNTKNNRKYTQISLLPEDSFEQQDGIHLIEHSYTPYISSTMQFSDLWSGRIGIKTTFDYRKIHSEDNSDIEKFFISWLPDVLLSYSPNMSHKLTFTLNSSIRQPNFDQINPFEWKVNNYSYNSGNTELKPETRHTFRLGYSYQGAISLAAIMRYNRGTIQSISHWNGSRVITRTENAQNSEFYRGQLGYYFNKLRWLNFSINAYWGKEIYHGLLPDISQKSSGYNWGINTYFDFVLNKSRTITAYLNGDYTGQRKTAVSEISPSYSIGGGLNWFLLKRKLSITLAGIDLLSSRYKGCSTRDNYIIHFDNRYNFPTFYLSVSFKFNQSKSTATRRQMSTQDLDSRF